MLYVGRGPQFLISNKNVSRKQIALSIVKKVSSNTNTDTRYFVQVTRMGINPSVLLRRSSKQREEEPICMVQNKPYRINVGDTLFLIPTLYPMTLGINNSEVIPPSINHAPTATSTPKTQSNKPSPHDVDKENIPPPVQSRNINIKSEFTTPQPVRRSSSIKDFFSPPTKRKHPAIESSNNELADSPITKKVPLFSSLTRPHSLATGTQTLASI